MLMVYPAEPAAIVPITFMSLCLGTIAGYASEKLGIA
jgi:hypothetical protein